MMSRASAPSGKKRGPLRKVLTGVGITLLVIAVALGAFVLITEGQRREDRSLVIADVDFSQVPDGVYRGSHAGWNQFDVVVTVSGGTVTQIEIADDSRDPSNAVTDEVLGRVVSEQSLGLDAVSGATITTSAILKAVERALVEQRAEE
jgi:fumarate reductase flavoprotein subunit